MNIARPTRLAVVPALFAALTLSACQDQAPTAAPPSPAAPTSAAAETAAPEAAPSSSAEPAPSESSSAAPAPESSSAPAKGGVECESSGGTTSIRLADLKPKLRTEKQTANARFGDSKVEITIGAPTMDTSGGDDFFPGEGKQTVIIPVTMKAVGGSTNVAPLNFGVVDGRDFPCANDVLSKVLPESQEIPIEVLEENESVSGKLAYAVPAGADLANFTLVFAEDYSSGRATHAWKLK